MDDVMFVPIYKTFWFLFFLYVVCIPAGIFVAYKSRHEWHSPGFCIVLGIICLFFSYWISSVGDSPMVLIWLCSGVVLVFRGIFIKFVRSIAKQNL